MQHINRLLHEARMAFKPNAQEGLAFIDYDNKQRKWIVKNVLVWDGVPGSGGCDGIKRDYETEYDTQEQASEKMHDYFKGLGLGDDHIVILFTCYGDLED